MELTAAEGRVLGCLLERQVAEPDGDSSLDELRFACNQAAPDAVSYDDRTVQTALLSLKSKGLASFVAAGHTVGPVRYRHRADQRWRLTLPELAVLGRLLLGGPQTADEVRAEVAQVPGTDTDDHVEASLDALAGRTPTPFATRISPGQWEGPDTLWAEVLTGQPSFEDLHRIAGRHRSGTASAAGGAAATTGPRPETLPLGGRAPSGGSQPPGERPSPTLAEIADRLTNIERRLAGIEAALASLRSGTQDSTRVIR